MANEIAQPNANVSITYDVGCECLNGDPACITNRF